MAEQPAQHRLQWEDFELDLRLGRLFRRGRRIRLQPIPLQILTLLLERPGDVVTRDELHHRIWNGYSYGDFDHSLNIAIGKLRAALADSAKQPRYIETLPQMGYRFLVAVETREDAPASAAAPMEPPARPALQFRRAAALAALVLLLALAGYWMSQQPQWRAETKDSAEAARLVGLGIPAGRVAYVSPDSAGHSFRFTGSGADYVRVPNNPLLEPEFVTVDAWVRAAGSPGKYRYIVAKGAEDCSGSSYALYTGPNGGAVFYVSGPERIIAIPSPPAPATIWNGKWHHLAGTFDGVMLRLYVDGAEVGLGFRSPKEARILYGLAPENDLLIGNFVGTCAAPFKGEVGEVQVFNRALSQTEIASLFKVRAVRYQQDNTPVLASPSTSQRAGTECVQLPDGLIGLWTAEKELQEDLRGLHPFQVGGVLRTAGKVGIGMQFLGSGHLEFRDAPQFNLTGPLTVEGWVYYTGFGVAPREKGVLVAKWGDPASAHASYGLFVRPNGMPFFVLSSDGASAQAGAPLPLVVELTHLAGTWDGTTMRLYANGVPVASAPFAGPVRGGPGPLFIGGRMNPATGTQEAISGILDEIGIYNRALTEKEILAIYRAGAAGKCRR